MEASRARKRGEHSARLLILQPEPGEMQLHWILLLCPGEKLDVSEKWRNAVEEKINLTGYELVRQTRTGSKNPAWTWRYTRSRHDDLREAVVQAIRTRRDDELRQLIQSIWRTPGFSGARAQVKKFKNLIESEWKRSRGADSLPDIPNRLGYVRRIPDVGCRLSLIGKLV